jgi:hypothetical protein
MSIVPAIGKGVSMAVLILVAAFAVGGVHQSAAVSNGNSAGDNISSIASRAHFTCVGTELASTFTRTAYKGYVRAGALVSA